MKLFVVEKVDIFTLQIYDDRRRSIDVERGSGLVVAEDCQVFDFSVVLGVRDIGDSFAFFCAFSCRCQLKFLRFPNHCGV